MYDGTVRAYAALDALHSVREQIKAIKNPPHGTIPAYAALDRLRGVREQIKAIQNPPAAVATALADFDKTAAALEGEAGGGFGGPPAAAQESLNSVAFSLRSVMSLLQGADVAPTTQGAAAAADRTKALGDVLGRWDALRGETLDALNAQLKQAALPPIVVKAPKDKVEREGPDAF